MDHYGDLVDHVEEYAIDGDSPIFDDFFNFGGDNSITTLINFTSHEFNNLWRVLMPQLAAAWTLGRGRKPSMLPKDVLFATLLVLKHFDSWDKHGIDLSILSSTLEKTVYKVIDISGDVLYEHFVKPVDMTSQNQNGVTFSNYPYALYATDVKFQPAYKPAGRFEEQKEYFSGKRKLYGYKIEVSVAPPGIAVLSTQHYPGSKADVSIFHDNIDQHYLHLSKSENEKSQADYGKLGVEYPDHWALLVDMGYQDAARNQISRNSRISSDRVLVENYFGRMCKLWNAMYVTFKWAGNRYDSIARICIALTNCHCGLMPLREAGGHEYKTVLAKYQAMGAAQATKKQEVQRRYRMRRDARLRASERRFSPY
ncbi:hypothetical protein LEN26_014757 [Aphanomyces euteiches]|nr:hypothetical protein LEN26_014757 [Aphanomyces euteiches]